MREWLTAAADSRVDGYGGPEPQLYAYAIFRPEFAASPGGLSFQPLEIVRAIATRIEAGSSNYAAIRAVLVFDVVFDGQRWSVVGLTEPAGHYGALLDPLSELGRQQSSERILEFWARWAG